MINRSGRFGDRGRHPSLRISQQVTLNIGTIMIWGIAGSAIGLVGGLIGTYIAVANTCSPCERSFLIRCSIACWIVMAIFVALMLTLPQPYAQLAWIPLTLTITFGIRYINENQQRIREAERQKLPSPNAPDSAG